MRRLYFNKGFTLTEIIVVIAIIALLTAAGGTVLYKNARESARDAQRVEDIARIASVIEIYRQDYGQYPNCDAGITIEPGGVSKDASGAQTCVDGVALLNYIQTTLGEIPHDPLGPGNNDYFYYYDYHQCSYSKSGETLVRTVHAANMERVPSNLLNICDSAVGNDGGWVQTTQFGGTKNPSTPYVVVLMRS